MKMNTITVPIKIKVKITLWSAIKLRIAGIKNIIQKGKQ